MSGLTAAVPLDLKVDAGASQAVLDLRDLRVRSLELQTGASETRVRLPRAAGATTVRAQAGAASLTIEVPTGVAARIRTRMALGSAQIDQTRFPPTVGGYGSPDYATSANRVDIDVGGGVGSLRVVGVRLADRPDRSIGGHGRRCLRDRVGYRCRRPIPRYQGGARHARCRGVRPHQRPVGRGGGAVRRRPATARA